MKNCPKCNGTGTAKSGRNCPACKGEGKVSKETFNAILKIQLTLNSDILQRKLFN